MIVLLMLNGADPAAMDNEGLSALHIAAQFGHTPIVAYLVAKGQPIDLQDREGMCGVWFALFCRSLAVIFTFCFKVVKCVSVSQV